MNESVDGEIDADKLPVTNSNLIAAVHHSLTSRTSPIRVTPQNSLSVSTGEDRTGWTVLERLNPRQLVLEATRSDSAESAWAWRQRVKTEFAKPRGVMRGSLMNRRAVQRFRQALISTVGSVKIKLVLGLCIGFTLIVLAGRASEFMGWTSHSASLERFSDSRFVKLVV